MNRTHVYLTRRNLLALLRKLDRNKEAGEKVSHCTIVKNDTEHKRFPIVGADAVSITAVEDEDYYDRPAGIMFEELTELQRERKMKEYFSSLHKSDFTDFDYPDYGGVEGPDLYSDEVDAIQDVWHLRGLPVDKWIAELEESLERQGCKKSIMDHWQ
jgi:hypothetical protein